MSLFYLCINLVLQPKLYFCVGTTTGCAGLSFTVTVSSLLSASEKQAKNKYPTILFPTMSWILCCISLHTIQPNCTNENIFVQPIMTAHVKEVQGIHCWRLECT